MHQLSRSAPGVQLCRGTQFKPPAWMDKTRTRLLGRAAVCRKGPRVQLAARTSCRRLYGCDCNRRRPLKSSILNPLTSSCLNPLTSSSLNRLRAHFLNAGPLLPTKHGIRRQGGRDTEAASRWIISTELWELVEPAVSDRGYDFDSYRRELRQRDIGAYERAAILALESCDRASDTETVRRPRDEHRVLLGTLFGGRRQQVVAASYPSIERL
jgi:hypothetical protein